MFNTFFKILFTIIVFISVFVLGISSCTGGGGSGRTPPVTPVPVDISLTVASTRADIVDTSISSGEGSFAEGYAPRIGSGNAKIEDIKNIELEGGTLILTSNQASLIAQQASELEVDFEMWIAAGEIAHVNDPSVIVVEGNPDLTWTANAKQITDTIYDFSQTIENFKEAADNVLDPVIKGNYTAFVKLTLKDNSGLLNENSSISLQNLHLNVVASELPNDATLIQPFQLDSQGDIIAFEATPRVINKGEKAILRWWVSESPAPLELTIDNGIGDVIDLIRVEVSPEQTTTYTLTIPTPLGGISKKATVIVVPEPDIVQAIKGHKGRVRSSVHSPQGNLIAATAGSYIHIFNASTGDLLRTLVGHRGQVSSLAFSFDGNKLASGGEDSIIKIWQVSDGTLLRNLALGHTAQVTSIAFSSDGKMFASGSEDRTVKLWEVTDGLPNQLPKHTLLGHTSVIEEIAFSPDSGTLASGSLDTTVKLWKVSDGAELHTLSHKGGVLSVAFSPDGNTLASGVAWPENIIKLWQVSDGTELHTLSGHFAGVEAITFHPDGNILASASAFIRLWQLSNGNFSLLREIKDSLVVNSLQFSPNGETLVAGGDVRTKLWQLSDLTELHTLVGQGSNVASLDFSSSNKLASGSYDGLLKLWQMKDDKELDKFQAPATLNSIVFNPAGNILATSYIFNVDLWQVSNSGKLSKLHNLQKHKNIVRSVTFSADGKTLASGSDDQTMNLWEVATGKELGMLPKHTRRINVVAFSPKDNNILAFSSRLDTSIKVWDIDENKEISNFKGHEGRGGILSLAFSPDGETLASSDHHTTIRLSRAKDGTELHTLSSHTDSIISLAFSPDGSILASGSADNTVKLWVVEDGTELLTLSDHTDWIEALAFSPDGRYLAVGAGTIESVSDITVYGDPDGKAIFGN